MTDIVERLRSLSTHPGDIVLEAADEIERLRARLAVLEAQWLRLRDLMDE